MKKPRYIPSWVIVLGALFASCVVSGICCILIFGPGLSGASTVPSVQSEQDAKLERDADDSPRTIQSEKCKPPTKELDDTWIQSEKPGLDTKNNETAGEGDIDAGPPVLTEPDDGTPSKNQNAARQKAQSNGISGNGEEKRYKIETVEAQVSGVPCTVYVRCCRRNTFSGAWETIKEMGDPRYGLEDAISEEIDPLADVSFIDVGEHKIARGGRCGYTWYGDSFFEAREWWNFFSGGRFRTIEDLESEETEWKSQQEF